MVLWRWIDKTECLCLVLSHSKHFCFALVFVGCTDFQCFADMQALVDIALQVADNGDSTRKELAQVVNNVEVGWWWHRGLV